MLEGLLMGTNFYWRTEEQILEVLEIGDDLGIERDRDDPRIHIGKRSAAGQYCWDCDLTLCKGGRDKVYYGLFEWWDRCPKCGKEPEKFSVLSRGPAAVELGFAKPETTRPTGCSATSSFSWAQDPERVGAICEARADEPLIEDEHGGVLTGREFLDMLRANCAIQFTNSVGVLFS